MFYTLIRRHGDRTRERKAGERRSTLGVSKKVGQKGEGGASPPPRTAYFSHSLAVLQRLEKERNQLLRRLCRAAQIQQMNECTCVTQSPFVILC